MKTIKLYDRRRYDRVIGLLEEDGNVVQMNFMQGDFKGASDMLTDALTDGTTDEKLMIIFRQMTKGRDAHDVDLLDLICETFCDSYVFSDVNQFTTEVKKFYRDVFDQCDTYFLSDYLEDEIDGYVGDKAEGICIQHMSFRIIADALDVDIHNISQEVAQDFLKTCELNRVIARVRKEIANPGAYSMTDVLNDLLEL
jgi:hypothetical protein